MSLLTTILEAIPDVEVPVGDYPDDFAGIIGGSLGGLDGFLPISETAEVVGWVLLTYVPVVVAFQITRWVYTHIPIVGNGD